MSFALSLVMARHPDPRVARSEWRAMTAIGIWLRSSAERAAVIRGRVCRCFIPCTDKCGGGHAPCVGGKAVMPASQMADSPLHIGNPHAYLTWVAVVSCAPQSPQPQEGDSRVQTFYHRARHQEHRSDDAARVEGRCGSFQYGACQARAESTVG